MNENPLQTPVQFVRGVGPRRAALLEKLGLRTVEDLLWYLPRDLLDLSNVCSAGGLREGELQTVRGRVIDVDGRDISRGRTLAVVLLDCEDGQVRGVWFNQVWPLQRFRLGESVLFSGKPKRRNGRWEIPHPRIQWIEEDDPQAHGGLLPRYGLTEGLKMHEMRRMLRHAVEDFAGRVPEYLPEPLRGQHGLPHIRDALKQVHTPTDPKQYESGRRRLIFDDLLEFQSGLALKRRAWGRQDQAPPLPVTPKIDARIRRLFPFEFTAGQNRAVEEIAADLSRDRAMHRLLQADVGAGKTAVALYAMLVAVAAGYQAVLMAPTEVLAAQHWNTVEQALSHSRVRRRLLTGHRRAAQRRAALSEIKEGDVRLVVGTQAVIQSDVEFRNLGVAVIDEQHKFGVLQRAEFSNREGTPHILVMTATPIPRSLCLTQFGDLDMTTIRDMPPGRRRVVTSRVVGPRARERAWSFLREQLQKGRQAYVICPRVEAEETGQATGTGDGPVTSDSPRAAFPPPCESSPPLPRSAEEVYRRLESRELRDFRVDLVHGQMDKSRKAQVMESFRRRETQVLVSTTVVEVGVDVPNATLMVINQAEHFGLSQLHQLRGRIARGMFQGYCFLFSDTEAADATRRLAALEETADGFRIAEVDFELRGPGDVLGTRQHGQLPLKVADLVRDQKVLREARTAAFRLVDSGEFDQPHLAPLKIRVLERFGRLMDLPRSG